MILSARKGRKRVSGARYPIRRDLLMTESSLQVRFDHMVVSAPKGREWVSAARYPIRRALLMTAQL